MEAGSSWVVSSTLAAGITSSVVGRKTWVAGTHGAGHRVGLTGWGSQGGGQHPSSCMHVPITLQVRSGLHLYRVFLHQSKNMQNLVTGRSEKPLTSMSTELCLLRIGSQSVPISLLVFLALMGLPQGSRVGVVEKL